MKLSHECPRPLRSRVIFSEWNNYRQWRFLFNPRSNYRSSLRLYEISNKTHSYRNYTQGVSTLLICDKLGIKLF